jgi:hypothetical protein
MATPSAASVAFVSFCCSPAGFFCPHFFATFPRPTWPVFPVRTFSKFEFVSDFGFRISGFCLWLPRFSHLRIHELGICFGFRISDFGFRISRAAVMNSQRKPLDLRAALASLR